MTEPEPLPVRVPSWEVVTDHPDTVEHIIYADRVEFIRPAGGNSAHAVFVVETPTRDEVVVAAFHDNHLVHYKRRPASTYRDSYLADLITATPLAWVYPPDDN